MFSKPPVWLMNCKNAVANRILAGLKEKSRGCSIHELSKGLGGEAAIALGVFQTSTSDSAAELSKSVMF